MTRDESPADVRALLSDAALPEHGTAAGDLLAEVAPLLFDHSLHNWHPHGIAYGGLPESLEVADARQ